MEPQAVLAQLVLRHGTRTAARRGEVLMREGGAADRVLALLTGRIKVTMTLPDGRAALLAVRGPGAVVGEIAATGEGTRTATVTAAEPVTFAVVTASLWRRQLAEHAVLRAAFARHLGDRLREADLLRAEHLESDTRSRLAGVLDRMPGPDEIPLTQRDLADLTGASLEATTKALRSLREAGCIATGRGGVTVLNAATLRRARPTARER